MKYDGEDRRRYPRSRRAVPKLADDGGPGLLNHIDNISANGVLCHTVRPVPMMTRLSMVFEFPKPANRRIECEGIVVRCDPHEKGDDRFKVAILFTKMNKEDHEFIGDFVEHDLAEQYEG
jgi:hypothetical protein